MAQTAKDNNGEHVSCDNNQDSSSGFSSGNQAVEAKLDSVNGSGKFTNLK